MAEGRSSREGKVSLLIRRSRRAVILLLGLCVSGQSTLSWALSASDVVNNTVVDVTMIDGCGDAIPGSKNAKGQNSRCWKKDGFAEPYPDKSSEICAYDNIGDQVEFSFNEVQVDDNRLESYLLVRNESGNKIFEKRIESRPFDSVFNLRRTIEWPLTSTAGTLSVGRNGKRYTANMERRIGNEVYYRSGTLEVFVDDCVKRQREIASLISDPSIIHNEGFDLYLELENEVATRICKKITKGLTEYKNTAFNKDTDSFQQRCRYQCINNSFTNKIVDMAKDPSPDNLLKQTHRQVATRSSPAFHIIDNWHGGEGIVSRRIMLLSYITMEDHLRAGGYCKCSGPLGMLDLDTSVNIVHDSIDQVLLPLGLASLGDQVLGQTRRHFQRTEELSLKQCGL